MTGICHKCCCSCHACYTVLHNRQWQWLMARIGKVPISISTQQAGLHCRNEFHVILYSHSSLNLNVLQISSNGHEKNKKNILRLLTSWIIAHVIAYPISRYDAEFQKCYMKKMRQKVNWRFPYICFRDVKHPLLKPLTCAEGHCYWCRGMKKMSTLFSSVPLAQQIEPF